MIDDFEQTFVRNLDRAAVWINLPLTRHRAEETACFGMNESDDSTVYFELKNTILCGKHLGKDAKPMRGICLMKVRVATHKRRQKYATRLLDRLKNEIRKAGLDFLCVDFVVSIEMKTMMAARTDFTIAGEHNWLSYVTIFPHENKMAGL